MRAFLILWLFAGTSAANAGQLEELAKQGYGVLEQTYVLGEFKGCDFGKRIPLSDGLQFVCDGYSYHYAYQPEVYILKNVRSGQLKVLIDDEDFPGDLYR